VAPALADLERLYRQLGHTPPWQAQPAIWEQYVLLCRAVDDAEGDAALKAAAEDHRAALAEQLSPEHNTADAETRRRGDAATSTTPADPDTDDLTLDLDDADDSDAQHTDSFTLDLDDLQDGIRAAVGHALMAVTGRLPL